ncbi:MAG: hypothetical protein JXJ20_11440 [Anaerolineae bacterium]|nr:hypothetical protein [Anaerolineae bacterium]
MRRSHVIGVVCCVVALVTLALPGSALAQGGPGGLQWYEGDVFELGYPANASLEAVSDTELRIVGPELSIRPAEMDFTVSGPAYQIEVTVIENPDELAAMDWAEQRVLAAWQVAMDEGAPNIFPVSDEGEIETSKFTELVVNEYPAVQVERFGGDAAIMTVYVVHGATVVEFEYRAEIVENNPLALVQQDIYALIMDTLFFYDE